MLIVAANDMVPPVSALPTSTYVRFDVGLLDGEHRPGTAETGGNFIGDEQQLMPLRDVEYTAQLARRMKVQARGHLRQRLDDDTRYLLLALGEERVKGRQLVSRLGNRRRELLEQIPLEVAVHAVHGIADRHGTGRVAVVRIAKTNKAFAVGLAAIDPILHSRLQGTSTATEPESLKKTRFS